MASSKPFVFFDIGETIVNLRDTVGVLGKTVEAAFPKAAAAPTQLAATWFQELGRTVPRGSGAPFVTQHELGARILADLLRNEGIFIDHDGARTLLRHAWDEWQNNARLCEGVTRTWLGRVRRLAEDVGAVTDGDTQDVQTLLVKVGLGGYFTSVTTSESVRAYKPDPRIYLTALRSLNAAPTRSLFVSHSALDLRGAAEVGMRPVLLSRGQGAEDASLPANTVRLREAIELNRALEKFAGLGRV